MVPGLSNLTYPERLKKLDIPTLRYRRIRGDMIQMYKLICKPKVGAYDCSLPSLFEKFPRDLRDHDKKLVYESHRLDIRKYSFQDQKHWIVIDSESIISFEKNLDKHWGKHEIYFKNFEAEFKPNKINKKLKLDQGTLSGAFI